MELVTSMWSEMALTVANTMNVLILWPKTPFPVSMWFICLQFGIWII